MPNENIDLKIGVCIDHAKLHFLNKFPESLPIENAYLHIGMFLGWLIDSELTSEYFEEEAETEIFRFKLRDLSPMILSEIWGGALTHSLINEKGNNFAHHYYCSGEYLKDYELTLANGLPSIYHVKDSWKNYQKISDILDKRFEKWNHAQ
ncbi:hypothetical protein [Persicobacter psychrovividus]|uniref:DUF7832 domain-containing protein n=1 Tax=Persicobacter psychrovividus TaxID=387638 RepID=A0ABM7VDG2_9BACT|nr:hypothetical protein PEPS_12700 [Persicobacter psychrovividus]